MEIKYLIFLLGLFSLSKFLLQLLQVLTSHFFGTQVSLRRYSSKGKDCWALVTGTTSGIGAQLSLDLAKRGFNIIQVARDPKKLAEQEKEIKRVAEKCEVMSIQFDFAKEADPEEYRKRIFEKTKGKDVAVLVNNAGIMLLGHFDQVKDKDIYDMVRVNCYPMIILTSLYLPSLISRSSSSSQQRSLLINVSSSNSFFPMPNQAVYGATKKFNARFSDSLRHECPQIDVLTVTPGFVQTKLINNAYLRSTVTAQECSTGILGKCTAGSTSGSTKQDLGVPFYLFFRDLVTEYGMMGSLRALSKRLEQKMEEAART